MKKHITTISSLLMVAGSMLAQNEIDALRYSQLTFGGTARYSGMAGSFGALGADFSTLSSNPAGIGLYRRGEFSFTPSIYFQNANAAYNGTTADDQKVRYNLGNIGVVFAKNLDNPDNHSGWKFVQFGVGLNKLASFNGQTTITGQSNSSQMDVWRDQSNGIYCTNLDPFGSQLAFNTYAIDTVPGTGGMQYSAAKGVGEQVMQTKTISSTGAYNEWVFSFGGNYQDKLFLGGTIGLPTVSYNEQSSYVETAVNPSASGSNFSSMNYTYNQSTTGRGFNFKLGAIYKPLEFLRVGLAVHSKTWLSLSDSWNSTLSTTYSASGSYTGGTLTSDSPDGSYSYSITTPMRVIGSVSFLAGKMGAINVDYEYVDYSQARLSSNDAGVFTQSNDNIKQGLTSAGNIRVGGELKLAPLTLRAGYAYYSNPFKSGTHLDGSRQSFTAGIGFRHKFVSLDLAYVLTMYQTSYAFYDPSYLNNGPAIVDNRTSTIMATLGFHFR
jgi:hypothetical protein